MGTPLAASRTFIHGGEGVPKSRAGVSHGVVVGNTCYAGGQLSLDHDGRYLAGDAKEEGKRAFSNLFAVFEKAGFDRTEIVFLEIAFKDMDDLEAINALYNILFPEPSSRPPRIVHEVGKLPLDAKIRVHGIAAKSSIQPEDSKT